MKNRKILLFLFLTLFFTNTIFAVGFTRPVLGSKITGIVRDGATNQRLPGVKITLLVFGVAEDTVYTDSLGVYTVTYKGIITNSISVQLKTEKTGYMTIYESSILLPFGNPPYDEDIYIDKVPTIIQGNLRDDFNHFLLGANIRLKRTSNGATLGSTKTLDNGYYSLTITSITAVTSVTITSDDLLDLSTTFSINPYTTNNKNVYSNGLFDNLGYLSKWPHYQIGVLECDDSGFVVETDWASATMTELRSVDINGVAETRDFRVASYIELDHLYDSWWYDHDTTRFQQIYKTATTWKVKKPDGSYIGKNYFSYQECDSNAEGEDHTNDQLIKLAIDAGITIASANLQTEAFKVGLSLFGLVAGVVLDPQELNYIDPNVPLEDDDGRKVLLSTKPGNFINIPMEDDRVLFSAMKLIEIDLPMKTTDILELYTLEITHDFQIGIFEAENNCVFKYYLDTITITDQVQFYWYT
ncbi:MAG: hypothetical protein ACTSO7_04440 [Candidatus Heimdallarchaeota archaeon]